MTKIWADIPPGRVVIGAMVLGGVATTSLVTLMSAAPLAIDISLAAHVAGLIAGYLVAVMVILMSRLPVLENEFGADRLARWHGRIGRIFIAVMLLHILTATAVWVSVRQESVIAGITNMLSLPWLSAATISGMLFVVVAGLSIRAARRKFSYEKWHAAHLLTYVALILSFGHEIAGPNLAGIPAIRVFWSLLYIYTFGLVLRYRILSPLAHYARHRLAVVQVTPEADGVVSILLRGRHIAELAAQSGQFFRWRFATGSTWMSAYPFSLSAPPDGDWLRITVKDLGSGSRLLHSIHPGTRVFAEGPYGAMTARKRTRKSVLLIAGGVGITPMRALFETLNEEEGPITLLYRASSPTDVIFREELEEIATRYGSEIVWMIGRSSESGNEISAARLTHLVPDLVDRDVYLCASPQLSKAVRTALRQAGLPNGHLHEENFSF